MKALEMALIRVLLQCALIVLSASLFVTSACSTSQPYLGVGPRFSESLVGPDTYRVTYEGAEPTTRLNALLVYRCAELAIAKGYHSFNIVYGYNRGTHATAIIRFSHPLTAPQSLGWHDAKQTMKELGSSFEVPPHEFASSPRLSFDLGTSDQAVRLPFVMTSIDNHTYRIEVNHTKSNPTGATSDESKLVDHTIWYRVAQFTVDSGADYFVILSGNGRAGTYTTGWGKSAAYHSYNERSFVIRLFKGKPPTGLSAAFIAKEILDSAGVELRLEDIANRKKGTVTLQSQENDLRENDSRRETNGTPYQVLFRDPSKLAFRRTSVDLEERLYLRCAQVTLEHGHDYFALVRKDEPVHPWQQEKRGDFAENGYAGGTPVFSGEYGPDMKLDDIRVWIQEFRKGDMIPTGVFVFDAQDVIQDGQ